MLAAQEHDQTLPAQLLVNPETVHREIELTQATSTSSDREAWDEDVRDVQFGAFP